MRLIDADEIKKRERDVVLANGAKHRCFDTTMLFEIPTVDAVEVVRCKDCKFYLNSNEKCGLIDTRLHFYETDKVWTEDCFCAWGERREDGTD